MDRKKFFKKKPKDFIKKNKVIFNNTFKLKNYIYKKKDTYCCPDIEPQLLFENKR